MCIGVAHHRRASGKLYKRRKRGWPTCFNKDVETLDETLSSAFVAEDVLVVREATAHHTHEHVYTKRFQLKTLLTSACGQRMGEKVKANFWVAGQEKVKELNQLIHRWGPRYRRFACSVASVSAMNRAFPASDSNRELMLSIPFGKGSGAIVVRRARISETLRICERLLMLVLFCAAGSSWKCASSPPPFDPRLR